MIKILFITLISNLLISQSYGKELNLKLIKSRLKASTITTYGSINKPSESFDLKLSKGPRMNKVVKVFSKNKKDISQVALFFYICGTSKKPYSKTGIHSRRFFQQTLKELLDQDFPISKLYMKELKFGEKFYMKQSLDLQTRFRKIRIKKERFKCDSQGGEGFRLDLFI
jgi:hypothetical protein